MSNDMSVKISGYSTGEKINLVNDSYNRQAVIVNRHNNEPEKEISSSLTRNVIVDVNNDGIYTKGFDNVLMVKLPAPTEEELKPTKADRRNAKVGGVVTGVLASACFASLFGEGLMNSISNPKVAVLTGVVLSAGIFAVTYRSVSNENGILEAKRSAVEKEIANKVPNFVSPKN